MATKTEICNLALSRIRGGSVGDVDTDQSPEAVQCRILYEPAVLDLLTAFPWNFCKKTIALTQRSSTPAVGWAYEYDYPNLCLQARRIIHPAIETAGSPALGATGESVPGINLPPIPFEVANSTDVNDDTLALFCNIDDAVLEYTFYLDNEARWPVRWWQALSWLLAVDLAIPLGGDSAKTYRQDAASGFSIAYSKAISWDQNQRNVGEPRLPRSIAARFGTSPAQYPFVRA